MVIDDGSTAVVGSDAASTIRIVRPGISRRHAVVSQGPSGWTIEDAGSRNGSYRFGQRFDEVVIKAPETIYLGHPTDGEKLVLAVVDTNGSSLDEPVIDTFVLPEQGQEQTNSPVTHTAAASKTAQPSSPKPATTPGESPTTPSKPETTPAVAPPPPAMSPDAAAARSRAQRTPREVEMADLTNALRDQINAVKGLTWSVWAMIAVTAALAVMTLFVGILGS
jgi:hypothetical protein